MASVPIKFRCFQCNQLLGVSRAKAGTVVNCPKCAVGLIVPEPMEPSESGTTPVPVQDTGTGAEATRPQGNGALGIEELLSEIRVEDIRVEPGVAVEPVPVALNSEAAEPFPAVSESPAPAPYRVEEPSVVVTVPIPEPAPSSAPAEVVVPPIKFEHRRTINERERAPAPRPRDINLPRSVVLAWSLFVLLALALAFTAGLLAGHFVWKVH